jgi:ATP-dependent Clp endopeptidase proteolytic subunit ClpP
MHINDIMWGGNDKKTIIPTAAYAPVVIENDGRGERAYDLPSRLLKDRIVMLNSDVNNQSANSIIMQLLVLSAEDPKADIYFYINSPGGSVTDGLALYDTMQAIPNDVVTICLGSAASMGSFWLSASEFCIIVHWYHVSCQQPFPMRSQKNFTSPLPISF